MERIKFFFKDDEKILWYDIFAKGKKRERNYVITNRRVYKGGPDIATEDFSRFPRKFLSVKDDILSVERIGIDYIKVKRHKSKFQTIKGLLEKIKSGKKYFEDIKKEMEAARKKLEEGEIPDFSLSSNSSGTDVTAQVQKNLKKQLLMTYNIEIYVKSMTDNKALTIFEKLSLPQSTKISNILKDETTLMIDTPMQDSQVSLPYPSHQPTRYQPYQQQNQSIPQSPEYLEVDQSQQLYALESFQTSSIQDEVGKSTTSRIIEFTDQSLFIGNYCFYCNVELGNYLEKVYYCENCGAYYHQSCLDNLMSQGICLNCNQILIW